MTVVCLVILAGIFWGDFFLKNYIESHVDERDERVIWKGKLLIRKHHNKGMMLNAGQKRRRLVAVFSLAFTLILTVVFSGRSIVWGTSGVSEDKESESRARISGFQGGIRTA